MLIAGTQSGCGKTTVTLALMQYMRQQGYVVAPFKAGPDFLDPMWHQALCERVSYNLDTRMLGEEACVDLFQVKCQNADVAVIEGVMGLFDGAAGVGGEGSSIHLAKTLEEPVVLVVNAKGMSGSIVPLVEGFVKRANSMDVHISGIIANHVGSENHANILRELLVDFDLPPLLAWVQKNAPQLPERHLGLKMPNELALPDFLDALHVEAAFTTKHEKSAKNNMGACAVPVGELLKNKTIAIAKDAACCFIYPINIEWLEAQGANVTYFSPLAGDEVPEGADAMWLPGGYPELHLVALEMSTSWPSIWKFIESDKPVLAECGGMMMLGQNITDKEGRTARMSNVLQCSFIMQNKLAGLGYREEKNGVRGHEFHHSKRVEKHVATEAQRSRGAQAKAFDVHKGDVGIRYKNLRASYIHWFFPSNSQEVASWFL